MGGVFFILVPEVFFSVGFCHFFDVLPLLDSKFLFDKREVFVDLQSRLY